MATTASPTPILFSVLTSTHENNNEDFLNQLRNHLNQIETNVQRTLNQIQQRKPYSTLLTNTNQSDPKIRNHFFDVLKDVANKNNLPFDEPFLRQQFIEKHDSSPSVHLNPSITTDINDQHLSPVNNARRSQFAPVHSSTPVHQTSPITLIPVDLSLATSSVVPVLTINSNDLPAVPPSAIVPQRANVGRPPRIPRGESVTRQKKNPSPIKEQQEEIVLAKEIRVSSKRRIKTKQEIIEDHIEVIIEQQNEILPEIIKDVQSTPLRGRKKKVLQDDINLIPQLQPPPLPIAEPEKEIIPKKTRGGRNKKKEEQEEVKPTRTASVRNRKKREEKEDIPPPPKKTTRGKKLVEPVVNTEEPPPSPPPPLAVRATPSRGKKKSPLEIPEPIIPSTPKKPTTSRSKKRKGNEETNENPIDTIQPPSPKRRGGRNTKTKNSSPVETIPTPPLIEQLPVSTRTSRRGKKDLDIPIVKQEDIVLNKKPRTGRGKKMPEPINTDKPITVVDVVMTSVIVSAPSTTATMDALVAKPPRPPIARKKKSIAMPPLPQTSPSTPPPTQRIQSTSPINDKALLPLPVPRSAGRRRRIINSPNREDDGTLETLPSITRNQKRTHSSVMTTPKRIRRDNLLVAAVPSTPGKKRKRCTCQKRRNRICDICAAAIDV